MGFGSEALEDVDDLLEIMGLPPSLILQSKSCFLKSLGELGLVDSGISLASEEPEAGWTIPVPLLQNVSRVMVSFPTHQACSVPFGFTFPLFAPSFPQCQFYDLLVFIKFAMTFHLGGLNSEALHFWSWAAGSSSAGPTCPGDSVQYRAFPPRHSLVHFHLQIHQQSSLSSQRDATSTGRLRGPFLPFLGDGSWRSGLARRKGVSETAGAQIGFAKRLITRPGIVPTSHMVS